MNTITTEKTYKEKQNKFILDFIFKIIPCTLIAIMGTYRLFTLPYVINAYVMINTIVIGILLFFYTFLVLDTIATFMKIRVEKEVLKSVVFLKNEEEI